ncbi:MAG: DUF2892 domain-containing protein [Thiotrichales bacterium]|nr:DUF2892 domain-containing protein [Thiotrichales bacterium]
MTVEKIVLMLAGTMVLVGSLLAAYIDPLWLLLTGFVGANLLFAGLTGFCPMVKILRKFGVKSGDAFHRS